MRAVLRWAAREAVRRGRRRWGRRILYLAPAAVVGAVGGLVVLTTLIVVLVVAGQNSGGCGTTAPVTAPGSWIKTGAQAAQYFESQGISANGAAGIVGNLVQESGLDPKAAGGRLAQWGGSRYAEMLTWTAAHGYPADSPDPKTSMAGQLMYIVYDLRTSYVTLAGELNTAPDPGTAATMFETTYELCSGVTGFMQVTPGSLCNDPARRSYAAAVLTGGGGGTAVPVSLTTIGCQAGSANAMAMMAAAKAILGSPYNMGNHAGAINQPVATILALGTDCSGFVSYLMGPAGLRTWTVAYATPGIPTAPDLQPGQGQQVTIWNNPLPGASGHVFVDIVGTWFESAGGIGAHQMDASEVKSYMASGVYAPFHPVGL